MERLFTFNMDVREIKMDVYIRTMKDKILELAAIGVNLDKEVKLALILNGLSQQFRYLVVSLEQQDLDFDELSPRLVEEAERYPTSPYNDIAGGATVVITRRGKIAPVRSMSCLCCGPLGHIKATCEVRNGAVWRCEGRGEYVDSLWQAQGNVRKGRFLGPVGGAQKCAVRPR
jgi:gag-polypeptide of LTR copia-type